ncbi:hypothetical protein A2988_00875 [Candidatus Azambacteria bacterium RIFCSPLOWO2_01_FULL_46_25]|uniref:VWFA domain-containing protein n=1 Tax=Candidatus Azambacteria bacterium RIFCSPLOWO2_01_FULL_46_25 TaxID=1797298 RepID=A0A1F5BTT6_9BACT|nr:MAG: hypothetical protein A2988_00875 [Candidatus Azambacteria bacterium RIFCSPLOWO2_01_FULL_46_25]OGD36557.1 MAG: hypothetical protein A2850_02240 [Candidatus Azambacteria bacterium RIFCSPHIGHO2_01_FULL_51_74]
MSMEKPLEKMEQPERELRDGGAEHAEAPQDNPTGQAALELGHRLADDGVFEMAEAQAEKERFKQRGQKLIDGNKFNFELFAESAAPRFRLSDNFYMLFEKKEVHMNADWFADRKFSDQQLLWATYHELAHFYDFANDHKAILKKFEQMRESARETGATLAEKYTQLRGEIPADLLAQKTIDAEHPERGTMNRFEQIAYGIHHEFLNIMDDAYVNSLVAKRKPAYGENGRHEDEVKRLYREQLFRESDFSVLPRHKQFAYALLRREMLPGEASVVSEEVEAVLREKHRVLGKEYTAEELVRELLTARNARGTRAGTRYEIIEKTLAPMFKELLNKDIADWQFPKAPETPEAQESQKEKSDESGEGEQNQGEQDTQTGKEGEGKQHESDQEENKQHNANEEKNADSEEKHDEQKDGQEKPGTSFAENIHDMFNPEKKGEPGGDGPVIPFPVQSPEDIKDIVEQFEKWQKEWQDAQHKEQEARTEEPAESREKRLKELRDKAWCERYEVDYKTLKRYEEAERKIKPYLAALDALWQRIIYGSSREVMTQSAGHFKEGEELDIDEAVREFSKILSGELDKVRVMRRDESVREMVYRPELIRARFVGDASGSMNAQRREILEQAFVLIFSSLRRFETYLNLTRGKTKSKLTVDTEAWVFGSEAERVKPFRARGDHQRERASIIRSFGALQEDHGDTRDDKALSAIVASLTPEEVQKIKSEKIMELVFELTDGGTHAQGVAAAKEALAELERKGVIMRAFQIGTTDESEQATFDHVWNTDRDDAPLREKRGEVVGAEIKNLIPALTRALAEYLSRVEL